MALDANGDLSARVRFLRISADDTHMLQAFWHIVEPKLPAILDGFYRHVTSEPRLQAMLGDKIPHLKQVQGTHWQRLFTGALDAGYYASVRGIGVAHHGIGLEPRW